MKNKITLLAFICILALTQKGYAVQTDTFSIYGKIDKAGRFYASQEDDSLLHTTIKSKYGGGVAVNALRLDYSGYFRGNRVSINYDFFHRNVVTPYLGISYVWDTDARIKFTSGKQVRVDGYDGIAGFSLKLLGGFIVPYVEYGVRLGSVNYGVRLNIGWESKRKGYE